MQLFLAIIHLGESTKHVLILLQLAILYYREYYELLGKYLKINQDMDNYQKSINILFSKFLA